MCRKRMEPFKCEYVPKDRLVMFMHKNSELWMMVYNEHKKYMDVLNAYCKKTLPERWISRRELVAARRRYCSKDNPLVFALYAMIQLEFNYMDSTVATGGILTRMVRIHEGLRTL